jgi:hypothetical protein
MKFAIGPVKELIAARSVKSFPGGLEPLHCIVSAVTLRAMHNYPGYGFSLRHVFVVSVPGQLAVAVCRALECVGRQAARTQEIAATGVSILGHTAKLMTVTIIYSAVQFEVEIVRPESSNDSGELMTSRGRRERIQDGISRPTERRRRKSGKNGV